MSIIKMAVIIVPLLFVNACATSMLDYYINEGRPARVVQYEAPFPKKTATQYKTVRAFYINKLNYAYSGPQGGQTLLQMCVTGGFVEGEQDFDKLESANYTITVMLNEKNVMVNNFDGVKSGCRENEFEGTYLSKVSLGVPEYVVPLPGPDGSNDFIMGNLTPGMGFLQASGLSNENQLANVLSYYHVADINRKLVKSDISIVPEKKPKPGSPEKPKP